MADKKIKQPESALAPLRSHIVRTRELVSGYSFLFVGLSSPVLALLDVLSLEELSCPSIKIEVGEREEDGGDAVWVHVTGSDCVKEFFRNEVVKN